MYGLIKEKNWLNSSLFILKNTIIQYLLKVTPYLRNVMLYLDAQIKKGSDIRKAILL